MYGDHCFINTASELSCELFNSPTEPDERLRAALKRNVEYETEIAAKQILEQQTNLALHTWNVRKKEINLSFLKLIRIAYDEATNEIRKFLVNYGLAYVYTWNVRKRRNKVILSFFCCEESMIT